MFTKFVIDLAVSISLVLFLSTLAILVRIFAASDYPVRIHENNMLLKTGDIVGVSYNSIFGLFVTAWSGSIWSHTGMIEVDENEKVFVLEAAAYRKYSKGLLRIPYDEWRHVNRRSIIGISRINQSLDSVKLREAFDLHKNFGSLDSYNWRWYRLLYDHTFNNISNRDMTCYELTVSVLQHMDVVSRSTSYSSYFPGSIMKGDMRTMSPYSYSSVESL